MSAQAPKQRTSARLANKNNANQAEAAVDDEITPKGSNETDLSDAEHSEDEQDKGENVSGSGSTDASVSVQHANANDESKAQEIALDKKDEQERENALAEQATPKVPRKERLEKLNEKNRMKPNSWHKRM